MVPVIADTTMTSASVTTTLTTVNYEIVRDSLNDNKKCGVSGSSNRLFELARTYTEAEETKCRAKCLKLQNCVAFSIIRGYCIGCDVPLYEFDSGAKAFVKIKDGNINFVDKFLLKRHFFFDYIV